MPIPRGSTCMFSSCIILFAFLRHTLLEELNMTVGCASLIERPCIERSHAHPGEVCSPSQISYMRFSTNVSICSTTFVKHGFAGGIAIQQLMIRRGVLICHSILARLLHLMDWRRSGSFQFGEPRTVTLTGLYSIFAPHFLSKAFGEKNQIIM